MAQGKDAAHQQFRDPFELALHVRQARADPQDPPKTC